MGSIDFYDGKCSSCGVSRPAKFIEVKTDRGDGVLGFEFWCLECVRGKK